MPCLLSPQGASFGEGALAAVAEGLMAGTLFLSLVPSALTFRAAVMRWLDGCNSLYLSGQWFSFTYVSSLGGHKAVTQDPLLINTTTQSESLERFRN